MMLSLLPYIPFSVLVTQLRFAAAGLIATGVNYGAFFLLLGLLGVGGIAAAAVAFFLSTSVNFTLQKFWTYGAYRSREQGRQLGAYLLMAGLLLGLNDGLFYAFNSLAHLGYLPTEALLTAVVSVAGYYLTNYIFTAHYGAARAA